MKGVSQNRQGIFFYQRKIAYQDKGHSSIRLGVSSETTLMIGSFVYVRGQFSRNLFTLDLKTATLQSARKKLCSWNLDLVFGTDNKENCWQLLQLDKCPRPMFQRREIIDRRLVKHLPYRHRLISKVTSQSLDSYSLKMIWSVYFDYNLLRQGGVFPVYQFVNNFA